MESTSHLLATDTFTSANTALLSSLAPSWLRNQEQHFFLSGPAKPWEVDTQERRRGARALLVQTALWSPSMNERDIILEAMAELPGSGRFATYPLANTSRHRLSAAANSGNRAALRDGTSCPSEVPTALRINQHSGVRVPRNKQLFSSPLLSPLLLPPSPHVPQRAPPQRNHSQCFCPAFFFSRFCVFARTRSLAAPQDKRADDWASPNHFHRHATDTIRNSGLRSRRKDHASGLTEARERHVSQERERRRSALRASDRLCDSTKRYQAGVHRNPIHCRPDTEFCGGRALVAAVTLHSREILARAPEGASTVFSRPLSSLGTRV